MASKSVNGYEMKTHADLRGADLCHAHLHGADLRNANLCRAVLRGATLRSAHLQGADLRDADLRHADLSNANLCCVNLYSADLRNADLRGAHLRGADMCCAHLQGSDMCYAVLRGATLRSANLEGANLEGANLRGATLDGAKLPDTIEHPPDTGDWIAWKKVTDGVILKCLVPATAARTGALAGHKCRAEYVIPLEAHLPDGSVLTEGSYESAKIGSAADMTYTIGEVAYPDDYDPDVRVECTHGVHLYMSKEDC